MLESLSKDRFDPIRRVPWRISGQNGRSGVAEALSGFQEPGRGFQSPSPVGVLGTADRSLGAGQASGYQEPLPSGFWEPLVSGYREPRLTVFSEPPFVVTGTDSRGFRNRPGQKPVKFQSLASLSTALNALTSLSNRISSNAAVAETKTKTPPLGGFAPAGSLRRFAATPRALTRPPTRHPPFGVGLRPTSYSLESQAAMTLEPDNGLRSRQPQKGLFGKSLAFSAENPRNRRGAASAPNQGFSRG